MIKCDVQKIDEREIDVDDYIEQLITSLQRQDDNSIIRYFHLIGCVSAVLNNDYIRNRYL